MKQRIKLSLLIVIATVSIALAGSNEREESKSSSIISTAESEFVSQCFVLNAICRKNFNDLVKCIPEVIILDRKCDIIASGVKSSFIVQQLILDSDFITNILGTEYYALNFEISKPTQNLLVNK